MKNLILKTTLICAAACISGSALASPDPSNLGSQFQGYDPGLIDNSNFVQAQKYKEKVKYEETKDPAVIEEEISKKMDLLNTEQVSFTLKKINITGNTQIPTYKLMRLIDFEVGQKVTINDLIMRVNDITDYYQSKGYLSTIAYLPPQKVKDGEIEIKILEGKYGNVAVNNGSWERKSYLSKHYLNDNNIKQGEVLNVKDVRNALTEMSTEEYMKGSISFSDNEESEEYTDISLDVKDRFPLNFDLRYDNQGRDLIGTQRGVLYAGLHDVTGHGDTLMGTLAASSRSLGVGGMYSLPIAKNDTRLNLGYSYSHVRLGKGYKPYNIKGDSHDAFIGISRRLAKSETYRLYGDITFDFRNTETTILGDKFQDYKTSVLRGSLTDVLDDSYGRWLFNAGVSGGIPIFGATDNAHQRDYQSNNFIKVNASAARLQVLPANNLAILQVNTQYANRHMFASEALSVGGISSVRGYDESFGIGDYGVIANFEYRTPIPGLKALLPEKYGFISDSIQLAGFFDFGWYGNRFMTYDENNVNYLMSAGPGIVVKLTKYISANMYWGFPIGKRPLNYENTRDRDTARFHFTLTSNIL